MHLDSSSRKTWSGQQHMKLHTKPATKLNYHIKQLIKVRSSEYVCTRLLKNRSQKILKSTLGWQYGNISTSVCRSKWRKHIFQILNKLEKTIPMIHKVDNDGYVNFQHKQATKQHYRQNSMVQTLLWSRSNKENHITSVNTPRDVYLVTDQAQSSYKIK